MIQHVKVYCCDRVCSYNENLHKYLILLVKCVRPHLTARTLIRAVDTISLAIADEAVRQARGLVDAFELRAI